MRRRAPRERPSLPVDPEEGWLPPGITGLSRQREWDAVATVEAPGLPGDQVELVALDDSAIEVVQLAPDPRGDDLELTWDGETLALAADGIPVDVQRAAALERLAAERERGSYVARARRLEGDLFELSILPL